MIRTPRFSHSVGVGLCVAAFTGLVACTEDPATSPSEGNPGATIGSVAVVHPAHIIAIGQSTQIAIELRSLTGTPMTATDVDSVRYYLPVAADTARITLDPVTGVVVGRLVTPGPALVNAFAFKDGAIAGDQAAVQVTATAITGLRLSIQPIAPDSARQPYQATKTIVPVLRNPNTGESVTSPAVQYKVRPADANRVRVYVPNIITPPPRSFIVQARNGTPSGFNQFTPSDAEGSAWLFATINAFGTVIRDSVQYTFTYPHSGFVSVRKQFLEIEAFGSNADQAMASPATVSISFSDALVSSIGDSTFRLNVTFDDPIAAQAATPANATGGASGNVIGLFMTSSQSATRRFVRPGRYQWTAEVVSGRAPVVGQKKSGWFVVK